MNRRQVGVRREASPSLGSDAKRKATKAIGDLLKEASSEVSSSFHVVVMHHLERRLGRDPVEVLLENSREFYAALSRMLTKPGADLYLGLVAHVLREKRGIDISSEEFVRSIAEPDGNALMICNIAQMLVEKEEEEEKKS